MRDAQETVRARLFALRDEGYRDFQAKLIPTVDPETVVGVRMPALRRLARELDGTPEAEAFLRRLPHRYYDENNLHGLLIARIRDYGRAVAALDAFLPAVDNWATCDLMRPAAFERRPAELYGKIGEWLHAGHPYTVRFGIGMLLRFYLGASFSPEMPGLVAAVDSGEYYVRMMAAWYFATALALQWDAALPYLQRRSLPVWTHDKAIQKALESDRIPPARKALLRTLKTGRPRAGR